MSMVSRDYENCVKLLENVKNCQKNLKKMSKNVNIQSGWRKKNSKNQIEKTKITLSSDKK